MTVNSTTSSPDISPSFGTTPRLQDSPQLPVSSEFQAPPSIRHRRGAWSWDVCPRTCHGQSDRASPASTSARF